MPTTIWLRHEVKENEQRTPLTPSNAKKLLDLGHNVIVEKSPVRIFKDQDYADVGCKIVATNSWITDAPLDAWILGLKELDEDKFPLKHKHIYFAHIYKGQEGAKEVFRRYIDGNGTLFDLEFLLNEQGRRVAAFGYWAGYVGAAISLQTYIRKVTCKELPSLTHYSQKEQWLEVIREEVSSISLPTPIVIGAKGRCGSGACDLFETFNINVTKWDFEETKKGGPFKEIIEHDIFVNCVLMTTKIPPFLDNEMLANNKRLKVIGDVSCDPNSELNPIPIYNQHTSWEKPQLDIDGLSLIAVDNLPSVLPLESSEDFSEQLISHLINLCEKNGDDFVWSNAKKIFEEKRNGA